jgi:chemotaxis protein MotA
VLLAYPYGTLKRTFALARACYTTRPETPEEIARTLLDLAVRSRVDGVLSLERMEELSRDTFLRDAVLYLVDNYKEDEMREVLGAEMEFFAMRRQQASGSSRPWPAWPRPSVWPAASSASSACSWASPTPR